MVVAEVAGWEGRQRQWRVHQGNGWSGRQKLAGDGSSTLAGISCIKTGARLQSRKKL